MPDFSYSVTETIYRESGQIIKLIYDYEEIDDKIEVDSSTESRIRRRQQRHFQAKVNRYEYERLNDNDVSDAYRLPFDTFIRLLRPIMMGTYTGEELREVFQLLDIGQTGTINVNFLCDLLSFHDTLITSDILLEYAGRDRINTNQELDFDEFSYIILRGIGRDIVCGHI